MMNTICSTQEYPSPHSFFVASTLFVVISFLINELVKVVTADTGVTSSQSKNYGALKSYSDAENQTLWMQAVSKPLHRMADIMNVPSVLGHEGFSSWASAQSSSITNMLSRLQQACLGHSNLSRKPRMRKQIKKVSFNVKSTTYIEDQTPHIIHSVHNRTFDKPFLDAATTETSRILEHRAAQFITRTPWPYPDVEGKALEHWEEAAKVRFRLDGTFEANFYKLITHYAGRIVIDTLYGEILLRSYPDILLDIDSLDTDICYLSSPFLGYMTSTGRRAISACERLTAAMQEHHDKAKMEHDEGKSFKSPCHFESVSVGDSEYEAGILIYFQVEKDVAFLHRVTVATINTVFWALLHIYSNRSLLLSLRNEFKPFVRVLSARGEDEYPRLSINVEGITGESRLLNDTVCGVIGRIGPDEKALIPQQTLVIVAALLIIWDMEPLNGKACVPRRDRAGAPLQDLRVALKRRLKSIKD